MYFDGRISTYDYQKEFKGWDMWGRKYSLLGFAHLCVLEVEETHGSPRLMVNYSDAGKTRDEASCYAMWLPTKK